MTVVEYQVAAHLRSHIAVVTAVEMKTSSVVLRSGTRSAAGNLLLQGTDDMALRWYTAGDGDTADRRAGEVAAA